MVSRSNFISKLVSVLLTSAFIYVVIQPGMLQKLSFFATVILVSSIMVISWSMGKFLSGEHDWQVLIPLALVVLADVAVFTLIPGV
jgi:hypothetical protein